MKKTFKIASILLAFLVYSLVAFRSGYAVGYNTSHNKLLWQTLNNPPKPVPQAERLDLYKELKRSPARTTQGDLQ